MQMILVVLYLLACLVCGIMGRNTVVGFIGHFVLAIIITPVGDFLIQIVSRPSRDIRRKIEHVRLNERK